MSQHYDTPFGLFNLKRIPDTDKNLQAWNSADHYMLKQVFEWTQDNKLDLLKANILILNDAFGALTLAMSQFGCDSYSDSIISHDAITKNINDNCPEHRSNVTLLKSTESLSKNYDLILFKEVKSHQYLKDQMLKVANSLNSGALIVGGIMAKNLQKSTLDILTRIVGPARASLTWKKARLLFIEPKNIQDNKHRYEPEVVTYKLNDSKDVIYNLANVFSGNKLDIGTRFFLQHFPDNKNFEHIIDLGCGNGVLSLNAAHLYPNSSITCIDESYMAVASAKMTLHANLKDDFWNGSTHEITFKAANALSGCMNNSADLILCNPPFHQQYVVGDAIAWQMFQQSKKVLKKGGELWIVGNRHLGYHLKLQKIFGNQKSIATNNKFVVIQAVKN